MIPHSCARAKCTRWCSPLHRCSMTAAAFSRFLGVPLPIISTSTGTGSAAPIAALPSGWLDSMESIAIASSMSAPVGLVTSPMMSGTRPARIARPLFPWYIHKLKRAAAASFFPRWLPSPNSTTSAGIAPIPPIVTLYSSITERLKSVAAAFSRASMLPFFRTWTMLGTAPDDMMLALLSSCMERFRRAVTACS
ncbi:Os12g0570075 [Oryza sativa Japonica Group]|uniref:Os12g0570075 protein n=1 Tax=Oryza sativa subsp. japonica TaxID=39947 RepID=A0A0P0YBL4_ORYSJ|nr:hypothetical protein EE612_060383 [Oryza sativa]BAT17731.1 Os12g0570075 [Oryza sativa Japonica Group]